MKRPTNIPTRSIKIELYHEYNEVDSCHCFGIVTENLTNSAFNKNYIQWIWFHIGFNLKYENARIYPYKVGKLLYSYKFCNDAERQGKMIADRIKSYGLAGLIKKIRKSIATNTTTK